MNESISPEQAKENVACLEPYVVRTPMLDWKSSLADELFGKSTQVKLKAEMLQHGGSFKTRGALTNMLAMDADALARGVTAVSAGNHAIAVAYSARALGSPAKVVMQDTANEARIQAARDLGAEVLLAPPGAPAFALAEKIAKDEGRTFIHPFEGRGTSLGTATVGVEMLQQAELDVVVVAIGGGGLSSGVSLAVKQLNPNIEVIGVEPEGSDTMYRSFQAGMPQAAVDNNTIADSLAPPTALPYSFSLCRQNIDRIVLVDDDQICAAMSVVFDDLKMALEPACCAGVAAAMGPLRESLAGRRVGIILCGSNMDVATFERHVRRGEGVRASYR